MSLDSTAAPQTASTVNTENPWPGLLAFRESDQEFFRGRASEIDELLRVVLRERLIVLFGLSGLGKSSLLQAGLFPRLRPQRVVPVYIRLDFSPGAPDLVTQVTTALAREAVSNRVEAPAARVDETLWEYFHRNENTLWNERNRPITPLLVFDQFEEVFTLGRLNEARIAATDRLIEQLADIAEGRPPAALKAHFDQHPDEAAAFQFGRHHYKILLSIREDFLPDLESLRARMPALALNRFRLRRMNGEAALQVVAHAQHLIDVDVARQVVRFVAADRGGMPLADLEVEPALLSVVCRELNNKRLQLDQERISADLLEGSQQEVLADFYERSVADLPREIRLFIEDRLLTVSGFRDSVALENALKLPGVALEDIDRLVERRLLRREDRGGVQRLELTHDLLAGVVRASRDSRVLREEAEKERLALIQRQEEEQAALLEAQEAQRLELERAREQEKRERERRELKQYRFAVVIVGALLLVAVAAALIAARATREAQAAQRVAAARELSTASLLNSASDPELGVLLAVAAFDISQTPESADVLHRALYASRVLFNLPIETPDRTNKIQVAADATGTRAIIVEPNGKVTEWDLSGTAAKRARTFMTEPYDAAAVSADRRLLAIAPRQAPIKLLNLQDARVIAELNPEGDEFPYREYHKLAFSPGGRFLAVARCAAVHRNLCQSGIVDIWDVAERKRVGARWSSISGTVDELAWYSDAMLAAGGNRGTLGELIEHQLVVWNNVPTDPEARAVTTIPGERMNSLVFDSAKPGGTPYINYTTAESNYAYRADPRTDTATPIATTHAGGLRALAVSADGSVLATAGADHTVRLLDVESGAEQLVLAGHKSDVSSMAFSRDGKRLVTVGSDTIKVWNIGANGELASWAAPSGAMFRDVSGDGRLMAVANATDLLLVDVPAGRSRTHGGNVGFAALPRNGERLAHATLNTIITIEDLNTGQKLPAPNMADGFVFKLDFSGDGQRLLLFTDGPPRLWDIASGRYVNIPDELRVESSRGAISDDGQLVMIQGTNRDDLFVWNVAGGQVVTLMPGADNEGPFAFSPDKRLIAGNDLDGKVILWDPSSGSIVRRLPGHPGGTTAAAFSSDSQRLASGGKDKMIRLWDLSTGTELLALSGPGEPVTKLAFNPDGRQLTAATAKGDALVYALTMDDLIRAARGRVTRSLTPGECRQFLHRDDCP